LKFSVLCVAAFLVPVPLAGQDADQPAPLTIGETFTVVSSVLGETRTINVYRPTIYGVAADARLPVLYMPDGGIGEDFLHVAGLVQILVSNGTMRPFLLVGIENTERRRDLTGPTSVATDSAIAPRVGGSAAFRRFIRTELMPSIAARYETSNESAIVGESLGGLFIVETFLLEPELFDTYIAFDPSLWWNGASLVKGGRDLARAGNRAGRTLYIATSSEESLAPLAADFIANLRAVASGSFELHHVEMPNETHGTIYHPAALEAFRRVFTPDPP
jgi:uncharacterized protein